MSGHAGITEKLKKARNAEGKCGGSMLEQRGMSVALRTADTRHWNRITCYSSLLAFLMVREQALKTFTLCKSHEFVSTLYLLEDVIPLVYYQIFRTGNLELYMSVVAPMAILFNISNQGFLSLVTLITKRTFFLTTRNVNSTQLL